MSTFTGRYGDLIPQLGCFVYMGGIKLLHTHRRAATADISCQRQQLLYTDQLHTFICCGFRGLFQIQLAAHRNAEYMNAGLRSSCDQGLENLLRRERNGLGGMQTGKVRFIVFIECFPTGDLRLFHKAYSVCFCCHIITVIYYTTACQSLQVGIEQS